MRIRQQQLTPAQVDARIAELLDQRERLRGPQRRWLLDRVAHRNLPLASHDDATPAEVEANAADGITISEFPVSLDAARRRSA
jgi:alpha-D-ribose 1-methylphosphonate 5-triphosphate diphosphatase